MDPLRKLNTTKPMFDAASVWLSFFMLMSQGASNACTQWWSNILFPVTWWAWKSSGLHSESRLCWIALYTSMNYWLDYTLCGRYCMLRFLVTLVADMFEKPKYLWIIVLLELIDSEGTVIRSPFSTSLCNRPIIWWHQQSDLALVLLL